MRKVKGKKVSWDVIDGITGRPMKDCPRCNRKTLRPTEVHNALSRKDNKTYICSVCGTEEAMLDYAGRNNPTKM